MSWTVWENTLRADSHWCARMRSIRDCSKARGNSLVDFFLAALRSISSWACSTRCTTVATFLAARFLFPLSWRIGLEPPLHTTSSWFLPQQISWSYWNWLKLFSSICVHKRDCWKLGYITSRDFFHPQERDFCTTFFPFPVGSLESQTLIRIQNPEECWKAWDKKLTWKAAMTFQSTAVFCTTTRQKWCMLQCLLPKKKFSRKMCPSNWAQAPKPKSTERNADTKKPTPWTDWLLPSHTTLCTSTVGSSRSWAFECKSSTTASTWMLSSQMFQSKHYCSLSSCSSSPLQADLLLPKHFYLHTTSYRTAGALLSITYQLRFINFVAKYVAKQRMIKFWLDFVWS